MAAGLFIVAGCGPIEYVKQVNGRAAIAVELARREGAERRAVYEFTAASEYLRKAKQEAAYAEYQTAIEYGRRAEELAVRARGIARDNAPTGGAPPRTP